MGGTSFDMCVIRDGRIPTTREAWVGQERVATKMVEVGAIGAGGGSIAWIDSLGLLRVGPQSAGADPGPAAYGRADEPTVTDADLVLGYLPADYFLGGRGDAATPDRAIAAIDSVGEPLGLGTDEAAEAIFETVNGVMADAVTEACTKQGLDVRGFALVAGGGAGGIHGAEIARRLGVPEVHCPLAAPVLSAMGMLTMDVGRELTRAGVWDRTAVTAGPDQRRVRPARRASRPTPSSGPGSTRRRSSTGARSRCDTSGQFHELTIDVEAERLDEAGRAALETGFHRRHDELYGYSLPWRADRDPRVPPARQRPPGRGRPPAAGGLGTGPARGALGQPRVPPRGRASHRADLRARAARARPLLSGAGAGRQRGEHRLRPGGVRRPGRGPRRPDPHPALGPAGARAGPRHGGRERDARDIDPITIATVWHSFQTTCREMRHMMERTAQSFLMSQLHDLSVGSLEGRRLDRGDARGPARPVPRHPVRDRAHPRAVRRRPQPGRRDPHQRPVPRRARPPPAGLGLHPADLLRRTSSSSSPSVAGT